MISRALNFLWLLGLVALWTVLAGSSASAADPWLVFEGGDGPGKGKNIVFVSGDDEYRSEEACPMLAKILSQRYGFRCTVLFAINPKTGEIEPSYQTNIPGLEALGKADLMVLFTRFRELPDEQMEHVVKYVQSGRPIIGLRTATHAFAYSRNKTSPYASWSFDNSKWSGGFGRQVLGETWISHHGNHGQESTRGVIPESAKKLAIVKGADDVWGPTDVYGITKLPDNAQVILEGSILKGMKPTDEAVTDKRNNPRMPIAWIRTWQSESGKTARIFCTTMGSSTDFESAGLRRLFVNACFWCLDMESQMPEKPNVDVVGEYKPTKFGFGAFQKGLKPEAFK